MIRSSYLAPSAVIAALSALSFHSEVQGQQATHAIHLLKPQDYYGRRAFGSPGQAWLGVYELNGTWEIRASRIRVDTIPTPRGCAREVTKVSVDERQQPLFLIQGLQGLAQGPIEVPFVGSIFVEPGTTLDFQDRKSTRLNSSHVEISYAVFCLKKKNKNDPRPRLRPPREDIDVIILD